MKYLAFGIVSMVLVMFLWSCKKDQRNTNSNTNNTRQSQDTVTNIIAQHRHPWFTDSIAGKYSCSCLSTSWYYTNYEYSNSTRTFLVMPLDSLDILDNDVYPADTLKWNGGHSYMLYRGGQFLGLYTMDFNFATLDSMTVNTTSPPGSAGTNTTCTCVKVH
jgi:hypothetical protein